MNAISLRTPAALRLFAALLTSLVTWNGWAADTPVKPGTPSLYEVPTSLMGTIYEKGTSPPKALFNFTREATRSGGKLSVLREFAYPDGKPAARERLVYEGNNLVSFQLDELQIGAGGSARIQREPGNPAKGTISFEYHKDLPAGGSTKTSSESLRPDTLAGDMIAPFLKVYWNELFRGEKVKCRYIVIPRRETVGFTFVKDSETTAAGRPALIIRMEATSPIIARLVDPLYFTVEKESPHRVTQYIGRVTPRTRKNGQWEDLDALFVFDWKK
jgi:hypothetical protein